MAECARKRKIAKHQEVQNGIFDAAAHLIHEIGYSDVTVRMICETAGVSIGMFYRNFTSKDDILSHFYERTAEIYKKELEDRISGMNIENQLVSFYTWIACFTADFGLEFVRHFLNPNSKSVKSDSLDNRVVTIGQKLLDNAIAKKEIILTGNRTSFDITHDILIFVKGSLLDWAISGGTYDLCEYVQGFLTRTIRSILA